MDLTAALKVAPTAERARVDRARRQLSGSRCSNCGTPSWPARAICHNCGSAELRAAGFSTTGTLLALTTVWIPRPGLEAPYSLGEVHLDDGGPRLFAHVRELTEGRVLPYPVRLVLAGAEDEVPPFWFVPVERPDE